LTTGTESERQVTAEVISSQPWEKKLTKGMGDNAEEGRSYGNLLSACEILVDLQVFKYFVISVKHPQPGLKVAKKLETILHLLA